MSVDPRDTSPNLLSIVDAAERLRSGRLTSRDLTGACLSTIARRNSELNAFVTVTTDEAQRQAARADEELKAGLDRGPLHGIPIALKDLIDQCDVPTTAASRVRANHVASRDASVVERLRDAGAVLVGKCNLHEFAFGTTSEDSAFGPVRHPLDPSRAAGGSSGGSAAAIVSGMCLASVGTDTGGSIRIPSSICGTVGLKPTRGEVPTDGVVPLSNTLDHVGPLTRSVADARIMIDILRGRRAQLHPRRGVDTKTLRIGVLGGYFVELLEPDVRSSFDRALDRLRTAGVTLEPVDIPHAGAISAVYLLIQLPEASAYHAPTLEQSPDLYTDAVRVRLELGRYALAEDYVRAMAGRDVLRQEVDEALEGRDALILPSMAISAPPLGTSSVTFDSKTEPVRAVMLRLTQLFNVTGHPAISLPAHPTPIGLPTGVQLVGRRGATDDLLDVAQLGEGWIKS